MCLLASKTNAFLMRLLVYMLLQLWQKALCNHKDDYEVLRNHTHSAITT